MPKKKKMQPNATPFFPPLLFLSVVVFVTSRRAPGRSTPKGFPLCSKLPKVSFAWLTQRGTCPAPKGLPGAVGEMKLWLWGWVLMLKDGHVLKGFGLLLGHPSGSSLAFAQSFATSASLGVEHSTRACTHHWRAQSSSCLFSPHSPCLCSLSHPKGKWQRKPGENPTDVQHLLLVLRFLLLWVG